MRNVRSEATGGFSFADWRMISAAMARQRRPRREQRPSPCSGTASRAAGRVSEDLELPDLPADPSCSAVRDEAVPGARQRFNIDGVVRIVLKNLSKFLDGRVKGGIEIHVDVAGPDRFPQTVTAYDAALILDQDFEQTPGLSAQADPDAVLQQFRHGGVEQKRSKPEFGCGALGERHNEPGKHQYYA